MVFYELSDEEKGGKTLAHRKIMDQRRSRRSKMVCHAFMEDEFDDLFYERPSSLSPNHDFFSISDKRIKRSGFMQILHKYSYWELIVALFIVWRTLLALITASLQPSDSLGRMKKIHK